MAKVRPLPRPASECIILVVSRETDREDVYLVVEGVFDGVHAGDETLVAKLVELAGIRDRQARLFIGYAQNFRVAYYHKPSGEMKGDYFEVMAFLPEDLRESLQGSWDEQSHRNRRYLQSTHLQDRFQEPKPLAQHRSPFGGLDR